MISDNNVSDEMVEGIWWEGQDKHLLYKGGAQFEVFECYTVCLEMIVMLGRQVN